MAPMGALRQPRRICRIRRGFWQTVEHDLSFRPGGAHRISSDADFLDPFFPGSLRYMRDYSARRREAARDPAIEPPRLYAAEGSPSLTGGMAEHRFRMRAADVEGVRQSITNRLRQS